MRRPEGDNGVFALLYAGLVLAMFGMAAIVVDLGQLRADKRDSRTAADTASLAAAADLGTGPFNPLTACRTALSYTIDNLRLQYTGDPCAAADADGPFADPTPLPCPASRTATADVPGGVTIVITWPVPESSTLLTQPDGKPGAAPRPADPVFDGDAPGCDRIAVAVRRERAFGLGAALGVTGGASGARSVARFDPNGGPPKEVAALNVLNPTACQTLTTGGQGRVIINRSTDGGPGYIAVESDGSACSNNNKFVVDLSANLPNEICASGPTQVPTALGACDGDGRIEQYALSPSGQYAFPAAAVPVTLRPKPIAATATYSWAPVTDIYGCSALPLPCVPAGTHIKKLVDAYKGPGAPASIYTGNAAYSGQTYSLPFKRIGTSTPADPMPDNPAGFSCSPTDVYIPPGNWFVDCPDGPQAGFTAGGNDARIVFGGGHIVFSGGVDIATNGACLAINVPQGNSASCPTATAGSGTTQASTNIPPAQGAVVFIRGSKGFSKGSSGPTILMPQTFVYQAGTGLLNLGGGTGRVLWTAPGAGPLTAGKSKLEQLCTVAAAVVTACLDSQFQTLTYWNERSHSGNSNNLIGGQAGLDLVGVFFTPRETFVFSGQAFYTANGAQFWVDILALSGQGGIALTPDARLNVERPTSAVSLVR